MQIIVNGKPHILVPDSTVAGLLDDLKLAPIRVAVERNEELVSRKDFAATNIHAGDRIEIVTLVGGG